MNCTIAIRKIICFMLMFLVSQIAAQTNNFEEYCIKQEKMFEKYTKAKQNEYNIYRKQVNEQYAIMLQQKWEEYTINEEQMSNDEKDSLSVYPIAQDNNIPSQGNMVLRPLKVVKLPQPQSPPQPIAPVEVGDEPYEKETITYYGTPMTIGFPMPDNIKLCAVEENSIANVWRQLTDDRYNITIQTALDVRDKFCLCDWAYLEMLQTLTEKRYGKTNEAVLMQAFLMVQSGYRIRMGIVGTTLYMLVACQYKINNMPSYAIDGIIYCMIDGNNTEKPYAINGKEYQKMYISKAKYEKEESLSLQIAQLPRLSYVPTASQILVSDKGIAASVKVNKNIIDFFNNYPRSSLIGESLAMWSVYVNAPIEKSLKRMLYSWLRKAIEGKNEYDAVNVLLNWVQTAFEPKEDKFVWGRNRVFFIQETLYYPYNDCEDRAILFQRIVRDLMGLDVVLLYYKTDIGHMATAVAFPAEVNGDCILYNNKRYVMCDPSLKNKGVGNTMPQYRNKQPIMLVAAFNK